MKTPATLRRLALVVLLAGAALVAWTSPQGVGDLRPSPDAVEYGLGAADIASLSAPRLRIGDVVAPSRYPFGFSLLAAPFVRLAAGRGRPEPGAAVLASLAAAVGVVGAVAVTGRRAFGAPAGVVAALLVVVSPFYAAYSRQVMAEMATAALFTAAGLLLVGIARRRTAVVDTVPGPAWDVAVPGLLLGALLALAVVVRLSNLQAVPAAVVALAVAVPARRRLAIGGLLLGLATGCAPLLLANSVTFGGPFITGYHLWTPEWAGAGRAAFGPEYALHRPALPGSAVQGNLAHYAGAWVGLPAFGDGGQPVGSPVHPTLAGALAAGAGIGLWRAFRDGPAARTLAVYVAAGVAGAMLFYMPYYYQDTRYLVPWVPLWLTLAAAGLSWPIGLQRPIRPPAGAPGAARSLPVLPVLGLAGGGLLLAALAGLPATLGESPAWQGALHGRRQGVSPRLAQLRALAAEAPPDAWIVSAIDGPLMDYHVLRGTRRRYVPLTRGLEFVDKPPFKSVPAASELTEALAPRLASGVGMVVIDRWSVEFAEGLPDFHKELDRLTAGADLIPAGTEAPLRPTFYVLRPPGADHGLAHYALRDGDAVRDSAGRVSLYLAGERRHVPSIAALQAAGLRWEDVRRLPDVVLSAIPEGRPLGG